VSIAIGDYVHVETENRVFKVLGLTGGRRVIPDNWLIGKDGIPVNPKYCKPYNGALSAIPEANEDIDCGYKEK